MQLVDDWPRPRLADGKALFGRAAVDFALDIVEQPDPVQCFGGDRRAIALAAGIEQAASNMCPAIGQHPGSARAVSLAELVIGFIAIDLQDTVIITEELRRQRAAPARHVAVNDRGWIDAAMRAVVAGHRPQVACLRLAAARREHLRGGLVDEQAVAFQKLGFCRSTIGFR